jgi:hypothetical protein
MQLYFISFVSLTLGWCWYLLGLEGPFHGQVTLLNNAPCEPHRFGTGQVSSLSDMFSLSECLSGTRRGFPWWTKNRLPVSGEYLVCVYLNLYVTHNQQSYVI